MPIGQITKSIGDFFQVYLDEGIVVLCRSRGLFKHKKIDRIPLVGDFVNVTLINDTEGIIINIKERFSTLTRPPIANVTHLVAVCSCIAPSFAQNTFDQLLVHAERANLGVIIVISKIDLVSRKDVAQIEKIYSATDYTIVPTSTLTGEGIEKLKDSLTNHTAVLAGKSGVGKSSLLSKLIPDVSFAISAVSKKLGQGRHTTRHVELFRLPSSNAQIADTPGFTNLSLNGFLANELSDYFPDFRVPSLSCRYRDCLHKDEPSCAVRDSVKIGEIPSSRYDSYLYFLKEITNLKRSY